MLQQYRANVVSKTSPVVSHLYTHFFLIPFFSHLVHREATICPESLSSNVTHVHPFLTIVLVQNLLEEPDAMLVTGYISVHTKATPGDGGAFFLHATSSSSSSFHCSKNAVKLELCSCLFFQSTVRTILKKHTFKG